MKTKITVLKDLVEGGLHSINTEETDSRLVWDGDLKSEDPLIYVGTNITNELCLLNFYSIREKRIYKVNEELIEHLVVIYKI